MTNLPRESSPTTASEAPPEGETRRDFLAEGGAIVIGGVVGLTPLVAGAIAFTDPLFPKKYPAGLGEAALVTLTTLDNLPDGGPPQQFPVRMDKVDAWTLSPNEPVGAVYLARVGQEVTCLNAICPHAGCFVGFDAGLKKFVCPCHDSAFGLGGERSEHSPSPRDLDRLETVVESSGEVKVKFQNFLTGKKDKVPPMTALLDWLDHRTGYRHLLGDALYVNIPGGARWRYVSGSALVFAYVTQIITGFFLWMYYSPSSTSAWESVYYIQHEVQGGWLLRGIHHFMASAMVVLLGIHLLQVVWDGAYKAPREMNYWIGLILMVLVLGLALTGYLLPWDQKGYWATDVATNLATLAPAGDIQQRLAVGGSEYGNLTLTRFFALHAGILPTLVAVILVGHLYLFRKHGITALKAEGDQDEFFWPKQVLFDAVACLLVLSLVVLAIVLPGFLKGLEPGHWGAELGAPADSSEPYSAARPEWYFLFLFQLLKYFEGGLDIIGAIVIPSAVLLILFLMPLWGHTTFGHGFNVVFILLLLIGAGTLTYIAISTDNYAASVAERPKDDDPAAQAKWDASRRYLDATADAKVEAERFALIAHHRGIPKTGANALVAEDPVLMGRRIFKRACSACHDWLDEKGEGIRAGSSSAPNLYRFASREWLTGLLDKDQIAGPKYFGQTKHGKSNEGMVNYVKDTMQEFVKEDPKALPLIIASLSAEAERGDQIELDTAAKKAGDIEKGRKLMTGTFGCTDCHKLGDDGAEDAPNLTGYGSQKWLVGMISDPTHVDYYFKSRNDRMPSYAKGDDPKKHQLTKNEIELLAKWLRGDYERYEK